MILVFFGEMAGVCSSSGDRAFTPTIAVARQCMSSGLDLSIT